MNFRSVFIFLFYLLVWRGPRTKPFTLPRLPWILLLGGLQASASFGAPLDLQWLRTSTQQYLEQVYRESGAIKAEISVGNFDARLRLESCKSNLEYKLLDNLKLGGTVNTQLSCVQPSWTILVPSTAKVYRNLPIASRNLAAGKVVEEADIKWVVSEMTAYRFGYALEKDQLIGMAVRFDQTAEQAFRSSQLTAPNVVKRGDEVTVEAKLGAIKVVSQGTAMSDGRIGQQIRVKNIQSQRLVMARVVGSGRVESIL